MDLQHIALSSADRKRAARASRDDATKAADRAKDAARKREARQRRTLEQKAVDNELNKHRMRATRAGRSEQDVAHLRVKDAQRKRTERAQETPLQREQRLTSKHMHDAVKKHCMPFQQIPQGCYGVRPRWELQYKRTYAAETAAIKAKEDYQRLQTPEAKEALEHHERIYQAALKAADAAVMVTAQQGLRCPYTYERWSAQQRLIEQREQQRQQARVEQVLQQQSGEGHPH